MFTFTGVRTLCLGAMALVIVWSASSALARPTSQTNGFSYQAILKQNGAPMNGSVDLQFKLFDAAVAGNAVGGPIILSPVAVADGQIVASLDFGALAFDGSERWLEVGVCSPPNNGNGPFTTLSPRQKLDAAPYAAFALNALLPATYGSSVNFNNAGNAFAGSGAGLTALNASNLASGTIAPARLSGSYNIGITGNASTATTASNVSGTVGLLNGGTGATTAAAARTNLGAAAASHTHTASDISGALLTAQLPAGGAWTLASNLNVDANTLVIDQTNNRVGVGTSAPEGALHVLRGSAGTVLANPNSALVVESSGGGWINILTPDGSERGILFGDPTDPESGGVVYDAANNNALQFRTGGNNTHMTLDGAGNLGVGTGTPGDLLHVFGGSSGVTASTSSRLIIEDDTACFINMLSPDASASGLFFGNVAGGATDSGIVYNATLGLRSLQFRSGGNQNRMTIASDGNVGIGTTNPLGRLHVSGTASDDTVRLPDDAISSDETLNEPGLASDIVAGALPLTATNSTMSTRSITAPTDGFVIAHAVCKVSVGVIVGTAQPFIRIDKTTAPASSTDGFGVYIGSLESGSISCHGVFAVSAGSNTFTITGASFSNNCTATFTHLTLLFVPSAYGTVEVED